MAEALKAQRDVRSCQWQGFVFVRRRWILDQISTKTTNDKQNTNLASTLKRTFSKYSSKWEQVRAELYPTALKIYELEENISAGSAMTEHPVAVASISEDALLPQSEPPDNTISLKLCDGNILQIRALSRQQMYNIRDSFVSMQVASPILLTTTQSKYADLDSVSPGLTMTFSPNTETSHGNYFLESQDIAEYNAHCASFIHVLAQKRTTRDSCDVRWIKRFCTISRGYLMHGSNELSPKGPRINLRDASILRAAPHHAVPTRHRCITCVLKNKREIYLAVHVSELDMWMCALKKSALFQGDTPTSKNDKQSSCKLSPSHIDVSDLHWSAANDSITPSMSDQQDGKNILTTPDSTKAVDQPRSTPRIQSSKSISGSTPTHFSYGKQDFTESPSVLALRDVRARKTKISRSNSLTAVSKLFHEQKNSFFPQEQISHQGTRDHASPKQAISPDVCEVKTPHNPVRHFIRDLPARTRSSEKLRTSISNHNRTTLCDEDVLTLLPSLSPSCMFKSKQGRKFVESVQARVSSLCDRGDHIRHTPLTESTQSCSMDNPRYDVGERPQRSAPVVPSMNISAVDMADFDECGTVHNYDDVANKLDPTQVGRSKDAQYQTKTELSQQDASVYAANVEVPQPVNHPSGEDQSPNSNDECMRQPHTQAETDTAPQSLAQSTVAVGRSTDMIYSNNDEESHVDKPNVDITVSSDDTLPRDDNQLTANEANSPDADMSTAESLTAEEGYQGKREPDTSWLSDSRLTDDENELVDNHPRHVLHMNVASTGSQSIGNITDQSVSSIDIESDQGCASLRPIEDTNIRKNDASDGESVYTSAHQTEAYCDAKNETSTNGKVLGYARQFAAKRQAQKRETQNRCNSNAQTFPTEEAPHDNHPQISGSFAKPIVEKNDAIIQRQLSEKLEEPPTAWETAALPEDHHHSIRGFFEDTGSIPTSENRTQMLHMGELKLDQTQSIIPACSSTHLESSKFELVSLQAIDTVNPDIKKIYGATLAVLHEIFHGSPVPADQSRPNYPTSTTFQNDILHSIQRYPSPGPEYQGISPEKVESSRTVLLDEEYLLDLAHPIDSSIENDSNQVRDNNGMVTSVRSVSSCGLSQTPESQTEAFTSKTDKKHGLKPDSAMTQKDNVTGLKNEENAPNNRVIVYMNRIPTPMSKGHPQTETVDSNLALDSQLEDILAICGCFHLRNLLWKTPIRTLDQIAKCSIEDLMNLGFSRSDAHAVSMSICTARDADTRRYPHMLSQDESRPSVSQRMALTDHSPSKAHKTAVNRIRKYRRAHVSDAIGSKLFKKTNSTLVADRKHVDAKSTDTERHSNSSDTTGKQPTQKCHRAVSKPIPQTDKHDLTLNQRRALLALSPVPTHPLNSSKGSPAKLKVANDDATSHGLRHWKSFQHNGATSLLRNLSDLQYKSRFNSTQNATHSVMLSAKSDPANANIRSENIRSLLQGLNT